MGCSNSVDVANQADAEANSVRNTAQTVATNASSSIENLAPLKLFRDECLKLHNQYRALHHAPPLISDINLDKSAQDYAEKMAKTGNFAHSAVEDRVGAGENLFSSAESAINPDVLKGGTIFFLTGVKLRISFFVLSCL